MDAIVPMIHVECAACGILFGLTAQEIGRLRESHQGFTCPRGHSNVYSGKSDAEKLREDVAAKERLIAQQKADMDRLSREKLEAQNIATLLRRKRRKESKKKKS